MALTSGGFLGASSPVGPRRTASSQTTSDLQQQALDAYIPGPSRQPAYNYGTPEANAYVGAVTANPNSYGQPGLQQGQMVDQAAVRQQAMNDDAYRGLQTALQFMQGIYGPELAQQQAMRDQLAGRVGFAEQNFTTQQGILQSQHGIDLARLGLEQSGIGIEKGAANRQIGNANILESLARQLLGNTQKGLDIDLQSLATNERSSNQQFAAEKRQAMSSAASRGAMNAPGIGRTTNELSNQLWNRNELIGQDRQRVGLGRERANLGFERERVGLNEQKAAAKDRLATLDLRSQGLGLDRKTLQNNLDQGLAKLGLDQWVTTNDLLDAMNSSDLQQRAVAEQIYRQALEYSDFFANLDPAALSALGLTNHKPTTPTTPIKAGRPV